MGMPFIEIVCCFRLLGQLIGQLHGQKGAFNVWISELTVAYAVDEWSTHFVFVWLLKSFSDIGFFPAESRWGTLLEIQTENYVISSYFCKS